MYKYTVNIVYNKVLEIYNWYLKHHNYNINQQGWFYLFTQYFLYKLRN